MFLMLIGCSSGSGPILAPGRDADPEPPDAAGCRDFPTVTDCMIVDPDHLGTCVPDWHCEQ
jgi:hypothetical protein